MDSVNRVYYDTNVWVAHSTGKDKFSAACEPLFDRAERGLDTVVVSHLVMAETMHALRNLTTRNFSPTGDRTSDYASMQARWKSEEEKFLEYVETLTHGENAVNAGSKESVSDHHRRVFYTLRGHSGRVTGGGKHVYRYAGLSHADVEHAHLALYAGAAKFYSTDRDFASLNDDPAFAGVSFEVLRVQS